MHISNILYQTLTVDLPPCITSSWGSESFCGGCTDSLSMDASHLTTVDSSGAFESLCHAKISHAGSRVWQSLLPLMFSCGNHIHSNLLVYMQEHGLRYRYSLESDSPSHWDNPIIA